MPSDKKHSREKILFRVCTRDIYMFLWDYAAIEKQEGNVLRGGRKGERHVCLKWVSFFFFPSQNNNSNKPL